MSIINFFKSLFKRNKTEPKQTIKEKEDVSPQPPAPQTVENPSDEVNKLMNDLKRQQAEELKRLKMKQDIYRIGLRLSDETRIIIIDKAIKKVYRVTADAISSFNHSQFLQVLSEKFVKYGYVERGDSRETYLVISPHDRYLDRSMSRCLQEIGLRQLKPISEEECLTSFGTYLKTLFSIRHNQIPLLEDYDFFYKQTLKELVLPKAINVNDTAYLFDATFAIARQHIAATQTSFTLENYLDGVDETKRLNLSRLFKRYIENHLGLNRNEVTTDYFNHQITNTFSILSHQGQLLIDPTTFVEHFLETFLRQLNEDKELTTEQVEEIFLVMGDYDGSVVIREGKIKILPKTPKFNLKEIVPTLNKPTESTKEYRTEINEDYPNGNVSHEEKTTESDKVEVTQLYGGAKPLLQVVADADQILSPEKRQRPLPTQPTHRMTPQIIEMPILHREENKYVIYRGDDRFVHQSNNVAMFEYFLNSVLGKHPNKRIFVETYDEDQQFKTVYELEDEGHLLHLNNIGELPASLNRPVVQPKRKSSSKRKKR